MNSQGGFSYGQIVLIGTDGIWEARNKDGDFFGKDPVMDIVRRKHQSSARSIVNTIVTELDEFQAGTTPEDDITLVVIKRKI